MRDAFSHMQLLDAGYLSSQSTGELPQYMVAVLALAGLVTMLSGLRKYIRRNVS